PGVQVGYSSRWLDFSDLTFDRQFNGTRFDPNRPIGEQFSNTSVGHPNVNAGVVYSRQFADRKKAWGGVSLYNINGANQSLLDANVARDRRWNVHATAQWKLNDMLDLMPGAIYSRQGPATEVNVGSSVKYILDGSQYRYRAVYAGLWWRAGDAGFASLGLDIDSWHAELSYDLNVSDLSPASDNRGGWEFALIYIIRDKPLKPHKHRYCPSFL
ncbi:MAG: type IX secretion system membrane protein PorP/SprF, partial [Bacteroidota bacterium]